MFLLAQIQLHDHPSVFGVVKLIPYRICSFDQCRCECQSILEPLPSTQRVPDDFMKQLKQNRYL